MPTQPFHTIMSGGQTGVDRAALDIALALRIPCGGWCPRGRLAEDGVLDCIYPLRETPTAKYPQRTRWNVRDSDGTLILVCGPPDGGTLLTIQLAARFKKPYFVVQLQEDTPISDVHDWGCCHHVAVLNVAGPRESKCPGIYQKAMVYLQALFF